MDIDEEPPTQDIQIKHFNQKTVTWSADTNITSLSEDFFSHLKDSQQKAQEAGELDDYHPEQESLMTKLWASPK